VLVFHYYILFSKHKFNLRSKECIFLGYASNSKGYLCLDPFTSRFYVSHHVVFNENHFPFSTPSTSSNLPLLHPTLLLGLVHFYIFTLVKAPLFWAQFLFQHHQLLQLPIQHHQSINLQIRSIYHPFWALILLQTPL
jgi:hypothetical protein